MNPASVDTGRRRFNSVGIDTTSFGGCCAVCALQAGRPMPVWSALPPALLAAPADKPKAIKPKAVKPKATKPKRKAVVQMPQPRVEQRPLASAVVLPVALSSAPSAPPAMVLSPDLMPQNTPLVALPVAPVSAASEGMPPPAPSALQRAVTEIEFDNSADVSCPADLMLMSADEPIAVDQAFNDSWEACFLQDQSESGAASFDYLGLGVEGPSAPAPLVAYSSFGLSDAMKDDDIFSLQSAATDSDVEF